MIETYIPWSVHETAPGIFDWGESAPCKRIEAFMDVCEVCNLCSSFAPVP